MFKRVFFEEWSGLMAALSFMLIAGVFVVGTLRALRIPKAQREHLANLPLEGAGDSSAPTPDATQVPIKP
ncbi:MAG: hypothetical protein NTW21_20645 [Verrucomicrobia bacterium]|nr:hypothetical protein [Verrucomicrobiota bacterium]